jgi:hypothetical protein
MSAQTPVLAGKLAGTHLALGGGGIGSLIIHLIIWHALWRLILHVWRIHTYGPILVIAILVVLVGASIWRRQRGAFLRRRRGGSGGYGSGTGPRDW